MEERRRRKKKSRVEKVGEMVNGRMSAVQDRAVRRSRAKLKSCCHFLSDRETVTSHHLRSSLAYPFIFMFVSLLMPVQCEVHTLINTHIHT